MTKKIKRYVYSQTFLAMFLYRSFKNANQVFICVQTGSMQCFYAYMSTYFIFLFFIEVNVCGVFRKNAIKKEIPNLWSFKPMLLRSNVCSMRLWTGKKPVYTTFILEGNNELERRHMQTNKTYAAYAAYAKRMMSMLHALFWVKSCFSKDKTGSKKNQ